MTILFAYDGSESADAAIAASGNLLDHDHAVVVEALRGNRFGGWPPIPPDVTQVDQRARCAASWEADA